MVPNRTEGVTTFFAYHNIAVINEVLGNKEMAMVKTNSLLTTCLAIALGFLIVDVASRYLMTALNRDYHIGKHS